MSFTTSQANVRITRRSFCVVKVAMGGKQSHSMGKGVEGTKKYYSTKRRSIARRRSKQFMINRNFRRYVRKLLKQAHPEQEMSKSAMNVMNNFINDMLDRITQCASHLTIYAKRKTLRQTDIQAACKLVLPPKLLAHAHYQGAKAVVEYANSKLNAKSNT